MKSDDALIGAMADKHPGVRVEALRLASKVLGDPAGVESFRQFASDRAARR